MRRPTLINHLRAGQPHCCGLHQRGIHGEDLETVKSVKLAGLLCTALGVGLGYLAATSQLARFAKAETRVEAAAREDSAWPRLPAQEVLPFPPTPSPSIA